MNGLKHFIRKSLPFIIAFLCFILGSWHTADAQVYRDTVTVWKITMKDGNIIYGQIMTKTNKQLFVKTQNIGTLALKRKDIDYREIHEDETVEGTADWPRNSLYSRYLLSPSGMLQHKGKGFYENKYVFINHFNVALSDGFSLGVGTMPLFLFDGAETPLWIVPKFKIPTKNKKLFFSTGLFFGTTLFDQYDEGSTFIGFLSGTYGTKNVNFSVSIGYGSTFRERMRAPSISYSGSVRVSKKTYLFLDNIFIPIRQYNDQKESLLMFTVGARTIWRKIALDFGLLAIRDYGEVFFYDEDNFGAVPYLGIVVPFR